jgi:hypothetical protein
MGGSKRIEKVVRDRAGGLCEYCRHPEALSRLGFCLDHVRARQHGGRTRTTNLAFACGFCNRHKGPNVAGVDPKTGRLTPLFNPRTQRWADHFKWHGPRILGLTSVGRTTVRVLAMNHPIQVNTRRALIAEGRFPPSP